MATPNLAARWLSACSAAAVAPKAFATRFWVGLGGLIIGTFLLTPLFGPVCAVLAAGFARRICGWLGGALARWSAGHVVVIGDGPGADALAEAANAPVVRAPSLTTPHALGLTRATHVAIAPRTDAESLAEIARLERLLAGRATSGPLVHLRLEDPHLLFEAREGAACLLGRIAPRVRAFSMDEIAGREALAASAVLTEARRRRQTAPHIVIFGGEGGALQLAIEAFRSLWSMRFEAPRVTILAAAPDEVRARLAGGWPGLALTDLWRADLAVVACSPEDDLAPQLAALERGAPSVIVVSDPDPARALQIGARIRRAARERDCKAWRAPIFVFAEGLPHRRDVSVDPPLVTLGPIRPELLRAEIYDQALEKAAAGAHRTFMADYRARTIRAHAAEAARPALTPELSAALDAAPDADHRAMLWPRILAHIEIARGHEYVQQCLAVGEKAAGPAAEETFDQIRAATAETFRAANRAVAVQLPVKLWDAGYAPSASGGEGIPVRFEDALREPLARAEKRRWNAERLLAGWKPGARRDNAARVHPMLVPWEAISEPERDKDRDKVDVALDLARALAAAGHGPRYGADPEYEPEYGLHRRG